MSDAQTRWENKRADDCAEHNQSKCREFPDHDCEECHSFHREQGEFNKFCMPCQDEKCPKCNGVGSYKFPESEDMDCEVCEATGRIQ